MLDITRRDPPHDIELEQSILGAVLAKNSSMDRMNTLEPEDFFDQVHAAMFAAMRDQWRKNRAVNIATLRATIQAIPNITPDLTMAQYVGRLAGLYPAANLDSLIEAQRDFSNRRRLVETAQGMEAAARDLSVEVQDTASLAVTGLDNVLSAARTKGPTRSTAGDAFNDFLEGLANDTGQDRVSTGLTSLDKETGGWRRKQFAILGGRPSMGKSAIATASMLRTARAGFGVLCFSLEMSKDSLAARCLSDLGWTDDRKIQYADALAGRLTDDDAYHWAKVAHAFKDLPVIFDEQRGLTLAEIAARTRAEAQRMERDGKKLGLVVVDHLGLIKPSSRYAGNKVHEVGEVSDGLCSLAKDQDIAVLALHQLNRATEGRDNKRPTLADLRNSGDLEQDADVVCFAYRESYYLERMKFDAGTQAEKEREIALEGCRNTLELLIAKNRNGPTSTVTLFCDIPCNVVRDLAS